MLSETEESDDSLTEGGGEWKQTEKRRRKETRGGTRKRHLRTMKSNKEVGEK